MIRVIDIIDGHETVKFVFVNLVGTSVKFMTKVFAPFFFARCLGIVVVHVVNQLKHATLVSSRCSGAHFDPHRRGQERV